MNPTKKVMLSLEQKYTAQQKKVKNHGLIVLHQVAKAESGKPQTEAK